MPLRVFRLLRAEIDVQAHTAVWQAIHTCGKSKVSAQPEVASNSATGIGFNKQHKARQHSSGAVMLMTTTTTHGPPTLVAWCPPSVAMRNSQQHIWPKKSERK